jgi:hypothetical protein
VTKSVQFLMDSGHLRSRLSPADDWGKKEKARKTDRKPDRARAIWIKPGRRMQFEQRLSTKPLSCPPDSPRQITRPEMKEGRSKCDEGRT